MRYDVIGHYDISIVWFLIIWCAFTHRFEDIIDVSTPKPDTVQLHLAGNRYIMLYTPKAEDITSLTEAFCIENEKVRVP